MTRSRSNWLGFAIALLIGVGALALLFPLAISLLGDRDDLARGWSNPARYECVRRERVASHDLKLPRSERGDFNGDGVDDELDVAYLHRQFVLEESTSGMVYVRSGVDGAVLLAHPIPNPLFPVFWCGDSDGDAADEIFVDVPPSERFAFKRDALR